MKDVRKTILYAAKIVPMRMIVYFLLTLPTLVLPVFMLKVQKDLVDLVSDSSEDKIKSAVILVFILLGLYLVNKVFDMFSKDFMEFGYFRYINLHMQREIHKKMELISLENYENVELFQLLERGQNSAKSIGEIVINTPAPAIAHAIYRATGVWHRELPITPEQIAMSAMETE